jgi:putative AbiEii toxin of type IV toxin-antitoxin system
MEQRSVPFEICGLQLRNIRGFRELDLDLRQADGRPRARTLIIGKNGTCKTSLLRAIAIGLADYTDGSRLISEPIGGLVYDNAEEGSILLRLIDPRGFSDALEQRRDILRSGDKESFRIEEKIKRTTASELWEMVLLITAPFVTGYGAGRFGIGQETSREYRIADSVYTLFNYHQPLIGTELTLRRLRDFLGTEAYERKLLAIQRALGLKEADQIRLPAGGGIEISGPSVGQTIPVEAWADGYRMTFLWIIDLHAWAMKAGSIDEDGQIGGILLIDEIEQHLHPSMQADILPRLSELLPKMQIFATTHSPLVALDARPEELVVLRREGDKVVAVDDVPDFRGYTVEDMLADPRLFDSEIYGDEAKQKLTEYRELAAIPKEQRDKAQRNRLRNLATEIRSLEGYSESENETSRLLKQFMAKYDL